MYLNVSYLGMKPNCFHENCPCVFHPQPAVSWSLASLLRRNVRQSLFKLVSAGRHSQVSFLGMNLETPTVDLSNLLFPTLKNRETRKIFIIYLLAPGWPEENWNVPDLRFLWEMLCGKTRSWGLLKICVLKFWRGDWSGERWQNLFRLSCGRSRFSENNW